MNKEKEEKLAEISARITKMIEYLGETPNSFATKLGYPRAQTIYDIQKKKSAPSFDFFQRFSIAGFSAIINYDWLLTGEGPMLREERSKGIIHEDPQVPTPKPDESILYNMYKDLMEEKKEKEKKIEQLTNELRAMERKVGSLEAKLENVATLGNRTADNVSTAKPSSQSRASAHSASAPLNE